MNATWDPVRALRALIARDVQFVVIGGFAANLLGSPSVTRDLDVCYDRTRANCDALAHALTDLHATLRGAPAGLPFLVASIDDVIRMKRAADRPKDRIEVEVLTAVKEERERLS
jgi:hypothetical protein